MHLVVCRDSGLQYEIPSNAPGFRLNVVVVYLDFGQELTHPRVESSAFNQGAHKSQLPNLLNLTTVAGKSHLPIYLLKRPQQPLTHSSSISYTTTAVKRFLLDDLFPRAKPG
jgi:hypothetical protein